MGTPEALATLNSMSNNTLMELLDIHFTEIGEDFLVATMPVTGRGHQPMGFLHGGATVALAESVGSAASHYFTRAMDVEIRGIEITANHLRSVSQGTVIATARAIHMGKRTHLWDIRVEDEQGRLISVCKLTCIALSKK
jgi:uncharacterized protein (TIGR00369 family)